MDSENRRTKVGGRMQKARKSPSVLLRVKLSPKNVREKFLIVYGLEGCQKAVNYLTKLWSKKNEDNS